MELTRTLAARRWTAIYFAIVVFWLGLLIGVSFLATPAKFMAPSLSLSVALDVGLHTFHVFNKVEWVLAAILIVIPLGDGSPWLRLLAVAASLLVIFETSWLLPLLDYRVGLIIAGKTPPPASLHGLYITMEVAKLFLLMAMAANRGRKLVRMFPMS